MPHARHISSPQTTEPRQFQGSFSGSAADSRRRTDAGKHTKETENAPHNRPSFLPSVELPGGTTDRDRDCDNKGRPGPGQTLVSETPSFICRNCGGRAALLSSSKMSNGSELLMESPFAFREGQYVRVRPWLCCFSRFRHWIRMPYKFLMRSEDLRSRQSSYLHSLKGHCSPLSNREPQE